MHCEKNKNTVVTKKRNKSLLRLALLLQWCSRANSSWDKNGEQCGVPQIRNLARATVHSIYDGDEYIKVASAAK